MSKLDEQGLRTLVSEIDKNINKKINRVVDELRGSGTSYSKIMSSDEWIVDTENLGYKYVLTHGLKTKNIFIVGVDTSTSESVFINYKIVDENTVEILSTTNESILVNIVNLNVSIQGISATINDTEVSDTTAWSSSKINSEQTLLKQGLEDLKNELGINKKALLNNINGIREVL